MRDGTVVIPRKDQVAADAGQPVEVWPYVAAALDAIGADDTTRHAARLALRRSDGCVVLGNYLNSEAKRVHRMDYRFKVPLIVLAASLAREDGGADAFFCPTEGCVYFETDDGQYSFHVFKDWTVDWDAVAHETVPGYEWAGEEQQAWALDLLLAYLEEDEPGDATDNLPAA
jgi:hypothetical protein